MVRVLRFHPAMLELISVSHIFTRADREALTALDHVSFNVPAGHLLAVIGATGSGKSTLLDLLAGLQKPGGGSVLFRDKDLGQAPLHANDIGYVPASDEVLHERLTVRENLMSALFLRLGGLTNEERVDRASHLLVGVGLETVAGQRVSSLSMPQRRRLKLALALVSNPPLVVCDEFTDGLDARAQSEMAALLKFVATDHPARVVVHATQMAANLAAYDTVVVLHEGHVCFHGPSRAVTHYFSIQAIEELYPRLAKRPAARWGESWMRHRESYYQAFKLGGTGEALKSGEDEERRETEPVRLAGTEPESEEEKRTEDPAALTEPLPPAPGLPALFEQAAHLTQRRWTLMYRHQREWVQHAAHLVLPALGTVLLILPNQHYLRSVAAGDLAPGQLWPAAYTCAMGWFIQVLFAIGFGVRAGAREIAGERDLCKRELTGGVRPLAWLLGRLGYVLPVVALQCFWLGVCVELASGGLPGPIIIRLFLLALTGMALACLSLAISAWSCSAERAHSRAWMLAYTNVLLAGALLGFPRVLGGVLHPFVTAYYGWSGGMDSLSGTPLFQPLTALVRTWFASPWLAVMALLLHALVGLGIALRGLKPGR